jgi:hypothetical protein
MAVSIHGSEADQSFALGATTANMQLVDAELGRISATAGLSMSKSDGGSLFVNGLSDANTDSVGTILLVATQTSRLVSFESYASTFNKGIIVQATGGIVFSQSVTTKNLQTVLRAGSGTLTIVDRRTLSTTNQLLTMTADDIVLQGVASVTTGAAAIVVATDSTKTVGLGTDATQFSLTSAEVGKLSATGLTVGSLGINSHVTVMGVTLANSNAIDVMVTLLATVDDSSITFATTASTFHSLAAQADNGVIVQVDITATTGTLYLDGDYENSSTEDSDNDITIAADVTVAAETQMTLEATTGVVVPAGKLTLVAGSGL